MAKLVACFCQVRRRWGGDGGINVSNPKLREFLRTALISGLLLAITTPLLCHKEPALQTSKGLAEVTRHGNKILSLSKLIFGEDPTGFKNLANQMKATHLAARSWFPHGVNWQSKKQHKELEPRKNGCCEAEGYLVILHTYGVYLCHADIYNPLFLLRRVHSVCTTASWMFSKIQVRRVLVSEQNEKQRSVGLNERGIALSKLIWFTQQRVHLFVRGLVYDTTSK